MKTRTGKNGRRSSGAPEGTLPTASSHLYVHVADLIYGTGLATWTDPAPILERAEALRPSLCGATAAPVVGRTAEGVRTVMDPSVAEYTYVWFYEPQCGPCREQAPTLAALTDLADVQVVTVDIDGPEADWAAEVGRWGLSGGVHLTLDKLGASTRRLFGLRGTPRGFLLDRDGVIQLKQIGPEAAARYVREQRRR